MDVGASEVCDENSTPSTDPPILRAQNEADDSLHHLKVSLEKNYGGLLRRLAHALRSHDRAIEALHAAYLRLEQRPPVAEVRNPRAYLYRMALNLAANVRLRELRLVSASSEMIGALIDDTPGAERVAIAKQELSNALAALDRLPVRRREIFLARWRDEHSQEEIAVRFRIHKRTVQKELARAEKVLRCSTRKDELPLSARTDQTAHLD